MNITEIIEESINKYKNIAFKLNYYLAEHPELPGREYNSCLKIVQLLNEYDINVKIGFFGLDNSFIGNVIKKGSSKRNIAILTEYDALPEIGHGCGHSASDSISVLSALVLKDLAKYIDANVDIIGTPDEEDAGLKIPMADNGVFDKYDCAIMVHLDTKNVPNWRMLAFETYEINFKGKPAHAAASPWEGRSALDGLMLSIHAFDMMRKSLRPSSIVEGIILEGGKQPNVIPEIARAKYTFRSDSTEYIKSTLMPWVKDILDGCSKATQTSYELKPFGYAFADMKYLNSGVEIIEDVMSENNMDYEICEKASGSSDMGNVSYRCPAFHPSVAITEDPVPLHTREFAEIVASEKSEPCIVNGCKVITNFIYKITNNENLLNKIKEEFNSKN